MAGQDGNALLGQDDPDPVVVSGPDVPEKRLVLLGDHAGNAVPASLQDLGLSAEDMADHIALDIGVEALGQRMSDLLQAPFVRQAYSRLVIDCNRDPSHETSIVTYSDGRHVPGNDGLNADERLARRMAIFDPYHAAIAQSIRKSRSAGHAPVIVSLHSFTPIMNGRRRPWEIGVLHNGANDALALAMLRDLRAHSGRTIGDNEPYRMDRTDFTVPHHAFAKRLPYVEIEVRQDVLSLEAEEVALSLAASLSRALAQVKPDPA